MADRKDVGGEGKVDEYGFDSYELVSGGPSR